MPTAKQPETVDKPTVLRAVTPGGHPVITALWLVGIAVAMVAVVAAALGAGGTAALLGLGASIVLVAAFVAYQLRLRRFSATLVAAEEALDAGDLQRARDLMAPLLARFHKFPLVQEVAADVLYAAGDPLSAASLWESAMKKLGAPRIAARLVAAYAALNRGGDARRVAALVPEDRLASLALAWSELAANGGDRARGLALADSLVARRRAQRERDRRGDDGGGRRDRRRAARRSDRHEHEARGDAGRETDRARRRVPPLPGRRRAPRCR